MCKKTVYCEVIVSIALQIQTLTTNIGLYLYSCFLKDICPSPGWSGGMRQTFYLELWDTGNTRKYSLRSSTLISLSRPQAEASEKLEYQPGPGDVFWCKNILSLINNLQKYVNRFVKQYCKIKDILLNLH